jgi:hypothetical protein
VVQPLIYSRLLSVISFTFHSPRSYYNRRWMEITMRKGTFSWTAAAAGFAASVLLQVASANSQEANSTELKGVGRYELSGTSQPSKLSDRQQLERYFFEGSRARVR